MFEGSLVESRGLLVSKSQRWTAAASLAVQCGLAALLIALPMLRPEMLPLSVTTPHVAIPQWRQPPPVQHVMPATTHDASVLSAPAAASAPTVEQTRAIVFTHGEPVGNDVPMQSAPIGPGMGSDANPLADLARLGSGAAPVVRARDERPVRVSQGVLSGMLLTPITPVYPAIAKAAGVQGEVAMEAVISKAGRIESVRVVSGPEMLRSAALDAVKSARYAPYRLSGEAVDVQTVITVVFRMGT